MKADAEVIEVVDITFKRKTGHTNHSFFIPIEGEAEWFGEVDSQRTATDDYPLAFLDGKRSQISIRLMLSPDDEEGALKRKLDYRANLVEQYANSVAARLIEFNKDLTAKMFAEFNRRKNAIVKAERELENTGLPRVYNPEHAETAIQIERLMRSLGAYVTDAPVQSSPYTQQGGASTSNNTELISAEQLYDKVKGLTQNTKPLDEYTARIIVESADDAIKGFGNTNQEKKVELRGWKAKAELALSPATIEELRKRTEGQILKGIYPKKSAVLRNAIFVVVALTFIIPSMLALRQFLSVRSDATITEPSPTPLPTPSLAPLVMPSPTVQPTPEVKTEQELTTDNLKAYLRKKMPDRQHSEPENVSELLEELRQAGFRSIDDVDHMLDSASEAYRQYEGKSRYSDVGVVRLSACIANDNYLDIYLKKHYVSEPFKNSERKMFNKYKALLK
jgi:hypothetical protein